MNERDQNLNCELRKWVMGKEQRAKGMGQRAKSIGQRAES